MIYKFDLRYFSTCYLYNRKKACIPRKRLDMNDLQKLDKT